MKERTQIYNYVLLINFKSVNKVIWDKISNNSKNFQTKIFLSCTWVTLTCKHLIFVWTAVWGGVIATENLGKLFTMIECK